MITSDQIRAARALLRWSAKKLANVSGVSQLTIYRMETAEGVPSALSRNLEAVQLALEKAGIKFMSENAEGVGVRFEKAKER